MASFYESNARGFLSSFSPTNLALEFAIDLQVLWIHEYFAKVGY